MYASGRFVLGALVLVVAVASESCTSDDATCSSLPASAQATAMLQVERSHKKEVASHHHHHHGQSLAQHHKEQLVSEQPNVELLDTMPAVEKAGAGFSRLALRVAADGFCIRHPCHASLLGNSPASKSHLGKSASLTQSGYAEVAALKDDMEMKEYILRVVDKYDCKVESIGGLMGIVPWFSGTTLQQDLEKLENTLLYAVLSDGRKASWLSYRNSDHITGNSAQLDFVGYVQVAAMKSDAQMKDFVKRVCNEMGVKVVDEGGFTGMVKYYSGTDNFQSFERLRDEVKSAANAPHSWAEFDKKQPAAASKVSKGSSGFSMLALRTERGFCKDFPCRVTFPSSYSAAASPSSLLQQGEAPSQKGLGKRVGLDQSGYAQVASMKDDGEMKDFITRVIEKYDCKVENDAGLSGIVPWFSGATTVQNLEKLENTVLYAVLTFTQHPWISYKNSNHVSGDSAELNFVGYVQVAAMRDDAQMQQFAKRVCDKLGVNIVNKDGFAGMVRFYSGTDNFQSYDKLRGEIQSAASAPNSWAKTATKDGSQTNQQTSERKESAKDTAPATAPSSNSGGSQIGDKADLSFQGYMQVASSRSADEMKKFARRACQKLGVKIVDEGGFEGMVKFFVGPDNFQSYDKLQTDIKLAASKRNSWCKYN